MAWLNKKVLSFRISSNDLIVGPEWKQSDYVLYSSELFKNFFLVEIPGRREMNDAISKMHRCDISLSQSHSHDEYTRT